MDQKQILHRYLDKQRKALVAKLDGVGERDVRWPMTQTGTNLLGLVKHVASVELGYFGEVFDRPSHVPLPWFDEGAEINADMWATAEESRTDIVSLYEQAAQSMQTPPSRRFRSTRGVEFRGGLLIGNRSPCNRSWCTSRQRSLGTQAMLTSSASSSTRAAGDHDGNVPDQTAQEWASYRLRLEEAAAEAARRAEAARP